MAYFVTSRSDGGIPNTLKNQLLVNEPPTMKPSRHRIKLAVDTIKEVLKYEQNELYRERLAAAGLALNNILIR